MYQDLREFITLVDKLGALRRIEGADPKFEIGGITEVAAGSADCPALLFERMPGCAPGFRVFTNATTTPARAALALGIDPTLRPLDALKEWMKKRNTLAPLPPVTAKTASFLENSMRGGDVDLCKLPAPYWHRQDGGPFIGSGSLVVMRDPDEGWINASIYRVQVQNQTKVTIQFDHQGRHGAIIAKNIGTKADPVRSPWSMARTLPCSSPDSNTCRRANRSTSLPAQSAALRLPSFPVRTLTCRSRRWPKSFWRASFYRARKRCCPKARSANSPVITPPTSGRAR